MLPSALASALATVCLNVIFRVVVLLRDYLSEKAVYLTIAKSVNHYKTFPKWMETRVSDKIKEDVYPRACYSQTFISKQGLSVVRR